MRSGEARARTTVPGRGLISVRALDGIHAKSVTAEAGSMVSQETSGRDVIRGPSVAAITIPPLWSCPQGVGRRPTVELGDTAW